MYRYLLVALVVIAVVPFLPDYIENRFEVGRSASDAEAPKEQAQQDATPIAHRIGRSRNGAYVVDAIVNGQFMEMMVDTGASVVALPKSFAADAGINLKSSDFTVPVKTANGFVKAGKVTLQSIRIGEIRLEDVEAIVLHDRSLSQPLLGMSALNKLDRFDFSDDTLLLVQ